jgi:hypothetical protein
MPKSHHPRPNQNHCRDKTKQKPSYVLVNPNQQLETIPNYRRTIITGRRGIICTRSIHRIPECLSLRRNWVPCPLPRKRVCPPWTQIGGATLACGEGGGAQFRRQDRKPGTLYIVLCGTGEPKLESIARDEINSNEESMPKQTGQNRTKTIIWSQTKPELCWRQNPTKIAFQAEPNRNCQLKAKPNLNHNQKPNQTRVFLETHLIKNKSHAKPNKNY